MDNNWYRLFDELHARRCRDIVIREALRNGWSERRLLGMHWIVTMNDPLPVEEIEIRFVA